MTEAAGEAAARGGSRVPTFGICGLHRLVGVPEAGRRRDQRAAARGGAATQRGVAPCTGRRLGGGRLGDLAHCRDGARDALAGDLAQPRRGLARDGHALARVGDQRDEGLGHGALAL